MQVGLLQPQDNKARSFCSSYLADHWGIPREEADAIITSAVEHKDADFCLIAKVQGNPVGMLLSYAHETKIHPTWGPWITGWYIVPAHRSNSSALTMLRHAQRQILSSGAKHVYLDSAQPRLQRFYQHLGFTQVGETEWNGAKAIVFRADLTQGA